MDYQGFKSPNPKSFDQIRKLFLALEWNASYVPKKPPELFSFVQSVKDNRRLKNFMCYFLQFSGFDTILPLRDSEQMD